jgi:hypothetical protein
MNAELSEFSPKDPEKALTSIRGAYTLSNTQGADEVEKVMVNQFLNTLAEVALTVASRRTRNGGADR